MSAPRSTAHPDEPPTLTGVSMRDLLASCAAAAAISRPPRPEPFPEEARGTARPATTTQQTTDDASRHRPLRRSA